MILASMVLPVMMKLDDTLVNVLLGMKEQTVKLVSKTKDVRLNSSF